MIWLFKRRALIVCSCFVCFAASTSGQTIPASVFFVANEGQWPGEFVYRYDGGGGSQKLQVRARRIPMEITGIDYALGDELRTALVMHFKGFTSEHAREEIINHQTIRGGSQMSTMIDAQNRIFEEMMEKDKNRKVEDKLYEECFIRDGIVNEEEYRKHNPRVVFLGKNPNRSEGLKNQLSASTDLDQLMELRSRETALSAMKDWKSRKVIARWLAEIHGIELPQKQGKSHWEILKEESDRDEWCLEYFKRLVLVDIAKTFFTAKDPEKHPQKEKSTFIEKNAEKTRSILGQQIRLYHPNIVVALGLDDSVIESLFQLKGQDKKSTKKGWQYYFVEVEDQSFHVILYSHFAAQIDHRMLHYCLVDAVKEIRLKGN